MPYMGFITQLMDRAFYRSYRRMFVPFFAANMSPFHPSFFNRSSKLALIYAVFFIESGPIYGRFSRLSILIGSLGAEDSGLSKGV